VFSCCLRTTSFRRRPVAPITVPGQDMVFGVYYLTLMVDGAKGEGRIFRRLYEVEQAWENGDIALHAKIRLRRGPGGFEFPLRGVRHGDTPVSEEPDELETTAGRLFFNQALPAGFGFVNDVIGKRATSIATIVEADRGALLKVSRGREPRPDQGPGFPVRDAVRLTISIDDVKTRRTSSRSSTATRGGGEGREPVPPRDHHR